MIYSNTTLTLLVLLLPQLHRLYAFDVFLHSNPKIALLIFDRILFDHHFQLLLQTHALVNDFIHECIYALVLKNTHFHVFALHTVAELFDFHPANLPSFFQVMLIAHYYHVLNRVVIVEVVLVYPFEQVEEGCRVRYVKHQDATMGVAVVSSGHSGVPLLACCVPDLQLHFLRVVRVGTGLTVHTHCYLIFLIRLIQSSSQ